MTKGLKDDLVKRLDEAVRAENQTHDNGVNDINHPKVPSNDATVKPVVAEQTTNIEDGNNSERQILVEDNNITTKLDTNQSLEKDNNGIENLNNEDRDVLVESTVSAETSVLVNEVMVSEEVRKQDSQTNKGGVSNLQPSGKVGRILEADLRAGDKDSCMCYTYSRSKGIDPLEVITKRSIRVVSNPEVGEPGVTSKKGVPECVLCKAFDFRKTGFGPRTVIICDQCEKEYYVGYLKEHNIFMMSDSYEIRQ